MKGNMQVLDLSKQKIDKVLGYCYILDKTHPLASKGGKIYVHRYIASLKIGRWLNPDEQTHHKNSIKYDNRPENLEVLSAENHGKIHSIRKRKNFPRPCTSCKKLTLNKYYCSVKCSSLHRRKVERPSKEILVQMIKSISYCAVGRKFGVSDNAVRKWIN